MFGRARPVALLLFGSGFCALIYQTTWLREFRLIFGTSTAATTVVLGVFMAGPGFGGIVLGKRSENDVFRRFFTALRDDPWPIRELISRSLIRVQAIATSDKSKIVAGIFNEILREPFCILNNDGERLNERLAIARYLDGEHPGRDTLDAIQAFEPHVPWQRQFLETRKECYTATHDPRAARATRDLERFMEREVATADAAAFAQQIQDRSVASETP